MSATESLQRKSCIQEPACGIMTLMKGGDLMKKFTILALVIMVLATVMAAQPALALIDIM